MANNNEELDGLLTEAVADPHLMLDELSDSELVNLMNQHDAGIAAAVKVAAPSITAAISAAAERMQTGGRLIYAGAGTSGRLGVLDASEIPPTFGTSPDVVVGLMAGGEVALVSSVEGAEDSPEAGRDDVRSIDVGPLDTVVGIAASGRTPYVLGALDAAKAAGALCIGLSCNNGTALSAVADVGIEVAVGPEVLTGSTRLGAGTATKMVLNMISTICMIRLGKTYKSLMVDMNASNAKLLRRSVRMVSLATGASDEDALDSLAAAKWNVKLAIATTLTGLSVVQAQQALEREGGVLRKVISGQ